MQRELLWKQRLRRAVLSILKDGQWHSTQTIRCSTGHLIPPQISYRTAMRTQGPDRRASDGIITGEGAFIRNQILRPWVASGKVERRTTEAKTREWRLIDDIWCLNYLSRFPRESLLFKPNYEEELPN